MRLILRLAIPVMLVLIAVAAFAQQVATPQIPTEPTDIMSGLLTAFAGKKWAVLIGFVLAGLIFVVRNFILEKWEFAQTSRGGVVVALLIGIVGVIAAELIAGTASFMSIIDGILATWVASGMFSQAKAMAKSPTTPASTTPVSPTTPT